jgi:hypothetical protein
MFKDEPISLEETNGIFVVTVERFIEPPPGFESVPLILRFWIDSKRGYTMVRRECARKLDTTEKKWGTMELSWEEKNDVWVPTSFKYHDHQIEGAGVEWTLDWSHVNENVPENYFDPTLLSDEVAVLASLELGAPVILGKIGPGREVPGPLAVPTERKYSLLNYILMGLGIFMIVLGLSKKTYDWWRK